MNQKHLVGAMLAATVTLASLAGCATPNLAGANASRSGAIAKDASSLGTAKPSGSMTTGQKAAVTVAVPAVMTNDAVAQTTAASLDDERDMEAYGLMADDTQISKYAVLEAGVTAGAGAVVTTGAAGVNLGATGGVKVNAPGVVRTSADGKGVSPRDAASGLPTGKRLAPALTPEQKERIQKAAKVKIEEQVRLKVEQRRKEQELRLQARVLKVRAKEQMAIARAAKDAGWVDNGDGTESKQVETDVVKTVNGKEFKRHVKIDRTRKKEGKLLIAAHDVLEETMPNGLTRTATRDKVLQDGGSYQVTFHNEMTFEKGVKRVADWTKTISAEGAVSGTGHIVWTDKDGKVLKDVKITLKGTEGTQQAEVDAAAGGAKVTLPVDGDAQVNDKPVDTVEPAAAATPAPETAESKEPTSSTEAGAAASADASASSGDGTATTEVAGGTTASTSAAQ